MKILLFMGNGSVVESAGGAEKVLCNMANAMTQRGHNVTIVCDDVKQGRPFYPLDSNVAFHNINCSGKKRKAPLIIRLVRKIINPIQKLFGVRPVYDIVRDWHLSQSTKLLASTVTKFQPDVVIPYFLSDAETLLHHDVKLDYPVILMLHGKPGLEFLKHAKQPSTKNVLSRCAVMQVLMPSYKQTVDATQVVRTVVIPNAVPTVPDTKTAIHEQGKSRHTIVMAGRLDKDKQQHFLIEAFAKIVNSYPDWCVEFYGGECTRGYRKTLENLIQKYRLGNQVFLKGTTNDPLSVLRQSDIFAFPSAHEGFGLALAEAMSVGLPCVGLKTCSAVNELIVDGVNGFLSENNIDDFAAKLRLLMDDAELRTKMGRAGHEMIKQYAPEKIWDQWESLLHQTVDSFRASRTEREA